MVVITNSMRGIEIIKVQIGKIKIAIALRYDTIDPMQLKVRPKFQAFLQVVIILFFFLLSGEVLSRVLLSFVVRYDVEMTKYGLSLKEAHPGAKYFFTHKPHQDIKLMGVNVMTNSFGLRDKEYSPQKSPDQYRIAVLGDSLTFGWGVQQSQSFVRLLEESLNSSLKASTSIKKIELINMGHGNYNTQQEVNYLLERGHQFNPDHVLLFYFINDAELPQISGTFSFIGHSQFATLVWSVLRRVAPSFFNQGQKDYFSYYRDTYRDDFEGWKLTKNNLQALSNFCRSRKIKLQIVILPDLHEVNPYPFVNEHQKLKVYLDSIGVESQDLAMAFKNEVDPQGLWVSPDDAHPNAKAHLIISQETKGFVERRIYEK